ncbi:GYD domain-containing protein [Kaistia adipata]|uniref:GYD domain-containing protein n=1 Tax=Kaistia adipata TaxID=166954 RepID=UPI0004060A28|nr:GYD domain-containing protein [Kaistia adipata]
MPHYLLQVSYTPVAVKAMVAKPQNREDAARKAIDSLGGSLKAFYFALGEYDVVLTAEFPDNKAAGALSLAIGSSGSLSKIRTTALMTTAEGMESMQRAKAASYSPPG